MSKRSSTLRFKAAAGAVIPRRHAMTSHPRVVGSALLVAAIWFLSSAQALAVGLSPVQQCDAFVTKLYKVCVSTPTAVPDPVRKAVFCQDGLRAGIARCAAVYGGKPHKM